MPLAATPPDTIALQTNRPDADLDGIRRLLHAATVAAISCVISSLPIHAQDAEPSGSIAASRDSILVIDSFDYPDAITGGLRRTTDMVRGVLERTRGDLTVSIRQKELERAIASAVARIQDERGSASS